MKGQDYLGMNMLATEDKQRLTFTSLDDSLSEWIEKGTSVLVGVTLIILDMFGYFVILGHEGQNITQ